MISAREGPDSQDDVAPKARHVIQGEFLVGGRESGPITTLLGSCIAACLFDPVAGQGGMNHFLLPGETGNGLGAASFGVNAMELLINGLIRTGAVRARLRAKLFGGARIVDGLSDIGARNAEFALDFLRRENIPCVGQSLGGAQARRILFWPATGRVQQRFLSNVPLHEDLRPPVRSHDLELF